MRVENNVLSGYIESHSFCRLYVSQRSTDDLTVNNAESEAKYLFSVQQNGNFSIHFDIDAITDRGVIVFYASCDNGLSHGILNYQMEKKFYSKPFCFLFLVVCNANPIHISDILQTKDSCVYVTFHYKGKGDVYVLNRVSKSNIPTARNIINEGIYLGQYLL